MNATLPGSGGATAPDVFYLSKTWTVSSDVAPYVADLVAALKAADAAWEAARRAYQFLSNAYSFQAFEECTRARNLAREAIRKATGAA